MGARSTLSTFHGAGDAALGLGSGAHFRLNFNRHVNTEWHFDYITAPIGKAGKRNVYHIGWSILYYPLWETKTKFTAAKPYFMFGHCFDYQEAIQSSDGQRVGKRWTAAPTAGVGNHFIVSDRIDFSLAAQYMLHVGSGFEAHDEDGAVVIHQHEGFAWDGHVLVTLSVNYKLKKLWKEREVR